MESNVCNEESISLVAGKFAMPSSQVFEVYPISGRIFHSFL